MTPNPAIINENVTMTMSYFQKKPITEAKCELAIYKSFIPIALAKREFQFCDKKKCPQAAGNYTDTREHFVPKIIPSGEYRAESTCEN